MLRVVHVDPDHADARRLVAQLDAALAAITGESGAASFDPQDCRGAGACFVLAYEVDGSAVGCGAVRALGGDIGELKRMYARPGSGAGAHVLAALERHAAACGYRQLWLSTRRVNARAVAFYERHGYVPVAPYGRYVGRAASVCLGRCLP
ncbi:GNAT family N-acetyltransferase [Oxalobacteraceae sp. CFBP 13730]|nr:GNAT family N-acetyltransferase [Oxalobacteraceae sp. CFBP 13730]